MAICASLYISKHSLGDKTQCVQVLEQVRRNFYIDGSDPSQCLATTSITASHCSCAHSVDAHSGNTTAKPEYRTVPGPVVSIQHQAIGNITAYCDLNLCLLVREIRAAAGC